MENMQTQPETRNESRDRTPLALAPAAAALTPPAMIERLTKALELITKSAARLEGVAQRSGLREDSGRSVSIAQVKHQKFFPQLEQLVRRYEIEAERIESSSAQINDLF